MKIEDKRRQYIIKKLRENDFDRAFSFWSLAEDEYLLLMHKVQKKSYIEISRILKRTITAIKARLKLHDVIGRNSLGSQTSFLDYILLGVNPITGEDLEETSPWKNPSILHDIEQYLIVSDKNKKKFKKMEERFLQLETKTMNKDEYLLLSYFFENIRKILPKLSDRDAELIKSLYPSKTMKKKTLSAVGLEFQISRERVRQIRKKVFGKLKRKVKNFKSHSALSKSREILLKSASENAHKTFFDKDNFSLAIKYMNMVLSKFQDQSAIRKVKIKAKKTEIIDTSSKKQFSSNLNNFDYFKIESFDTFRPQNSKSPFNSEPFTLEIINEKRKNNISNGKLINTGFPITFEEIETILLKYDEGMSLVEMEKYFQRSKNSLENLLNQAIAERIVNEEKNVAHKKPSDFFRIEQLDSYTPYNKFSKFSLSEIEDHRKRNQRQGFPLNNWVPVTHEEVKLLLEMYKTKKNLKALESYFQRSAKALSRIIEDNKDKNT